MIFDTHVHYEDEAFDEDRESLVMSLPDNGIGTVVNVSSTWRSLEKTKALTEKYDFVYGAYGIHPENIKDLEMEETIDAVRRYCEGEKAVAVGEIGLDYYWDKDNKAQQIAWFRSQLELARELKLPVIIHSRDAAEDTLKVSKEMRLSEIGGVMHCFSYSVEMAREYLSMGLYLGIGGVVTFKNAKKLKEVVAMAPLEQLVLETDCPYLAPVPNRGKRNSSLNLPYVAEMIAQLKNVSAEEVISITNLNAHRMYQLDYL